MKFPFGILLGCLLTIGLPFCEASEYKHELTVCAIFKNETKWLPEWIDFHLKQGVEHFYLYDNESDDHPEVVLKPYLEKGQVEIIPWNDRFATTWHWNQIQQKAYSDCIEKIRDTSKWCAFIDIDEYLFCPDKTSLPTKLKEYDEFAAVVVNWVMYGTSDIQKIPQGKKMTDVLVMRPPLSYSRNVYVKSIVKPKCVLTCPNCHIFAFKDQRPKLKCVTENKESCTWQCTKKNSVKVFRINHYYTRDKDFFENVKLKQRNWKNIADHFQDETKELNQEYDPILSEAQ